jgi:integrase
MDRRRGPPLSQQGPDRHLCAAVATSAQNGAQTRRTARLAGSDLDLDRGTLTVQQTIGVLAGAPCIKPPKTDAGQRVVKLSADVVAALTNHRITWAARNLAAEEWADGDLVFCAGEGKPINPNNLYRNFAAIVDRAGVLTIRLHDLRHTHATPLLSAGTPIKAVSERLGHAKTSITLDTYAHVLPDMQDRGVEAIDAALSSTAS